jgi:hypothetical protein
MNGLPSPLSSADAEKVREVMRLLASMRNQEAGAAMVARLALMVAKTPHALSDRQPHNEKRGD